MPDQGRVDSRPRQAPGMPASRTPRGTRTPNLLILSQTPLPNWATGAWVGFLPTRTASCPLEASDALIVAPHAEGARFELATV